MTSVNETWLDEPLRKFVNDARVARVVVLQPSGRVLGQVGFGSADEVMSACALTAAINASGGELGRLLEGRAFPVLHHAGREKEVFIGRCEGAGKPCLLLAVYDRETSLGLVRLYFEKFRTALKATEPVLEELPRSGSDFEASLNRSLDALFGPLS